MKKTGIIVLSIGLLFTMFTTFELLVKEHVKDMGQIENAQVMTYNRIWEPMVGAIVIIVGVFIYKAGRKEKVKFV